MASGSYDSLVISGGGVKGFLSLGAIQYYIDRGLLDVASLTEFAGTSIGSVICLLLVCGYTPKEILEEVGSIMCNLIDFENINIIELANNYGFTRIDKFIAQISKMVMDKLGEIPSLKRLYELTGKRLVVCATNLTKMKVETYSYEDTPHLSCVNAVKISSSLPIIFSRMSYRGCFVADGGILNNVPHDYISPASRKMLCIVTIGGDASLNKSESMFSYFYRLIMTPIYHLTSIRCNHIRENADLLKINYSGSLLPLSVSEEQSIELFMTGYEYAQMHTSMQFFQVDV